MRVVVTCLLVSSLALAAPVNPSPVAKGAFDRAEKALAAGDIDKAVADYQAALKGTPGWAPALNGLGSALFKQNKREEAIEQFKAATAADPAFKLGWFNLGYACRKTSDFAAAANAYEKYTALDPKDPDGFYGLGEAYKALNDAPRAIAAFEQYLVKEARPTEQKWVDRAKDSITQLKAQSQAAPAPAPTPTPVAAVAPEQVEAPAPVAQLNTLAQKKVAEGDQFMAEKRYREASFAYQDAVNAAPDSVEALFKLGNSYAVLGYYAQAIERWTRVAQVSPDAAVRKSAQDNVARAQQKMAQAGGSSPEAAGQAPGQGPVADATRQKARAYYEQGVQLITQRRYGEALASLSECLKLEPTLSVGYIARGSALIGLRRFAEAALDYNYALKLDPATSAPLYGLAEAYRGMDRIDDARGYYQKYVASGATDVRPELQSDARAKLERLR